MAGDILLYKASRVPVGEDQSAHLELTREIARRFNYFYGPIFPEPETLLTPTPKVPGTDGRKMSKSYGNSLNISEDLKELWEKLRTMKTDPQRERRKDPGNPDVCPVWDIQKVFNPDHQEREKLETGCRTAGIGCIECKKALFAHLERLLDPIQQRRKYYEQHGDELEGILREGASRAKAVAERTMDEIVQAIGLFR
jgi:tryptophanyl-tRNA synthetase